MAVPHEMMWCATVRMKSLQERIAAMQAAGLQNMSLFPIDFRHAREAGLAPATMRQMLDDAGLRVVVIDPYTRWVPQWNPPASMSPDDVAFTDFDEDEIFEMAHTFGVESINVIESFGNSFSADALAEAFARVCDRAAQDNLVVHVEFMPFSGIPDLATAWEIVQKAGRANSGITLDTWHYFRGNVNDDLLQTIPGNRIRRVQVADAQWQVQGDLMNDLLHFRRPPGEDDFPLVPLMQKLLQMDALQSVGVELFSDVFDQMTATDAVQRASASLETLYKADKTLR